MENADQLKYAIGISFESPASSQARETLNRSTAYRCCDTVSIPFSSWSICQVTGL